MPTSNNSRNPQRPRAGSQDDKAWPTSPLLQTGSRSSRGDFPLQQFSELLYAQTGIFIDDKKHYLLQAKVDRLLMKKRILSYEEYWRLLNQPNNHTDFQEFIDMMTTNTTEFFRENDHFDYLRQNFDAIMLDNPRIQRNGEVVIWSAASSTGQEPVSLAMVMLELLQSYNLSVRILATDIDSQVLHKAIHGVYSKQECVGIPVPLLQKYFQPMDSGEYRTTELLRSVITYRQFNLMNPFRFRYGFDFVFCRNVMIYFDSLTQQALVEKFYDVLVPGGLFFLGHSESMINKQHRYRPVTVSIWAK